VHDAVQNQVMERIVDTYATFLSFSDPILLQSDLDNLAMEAAKVLPAQHAAISEMLGYSNAKVDSRLNYLDPFKTRMTFYVLMLLSRIRNNSNFSNWSLLQSAVAYGSSSQSSARRLPIFFENLFSSDNHER
jgi:hypothetical protein